jgi:uncharacterized membrane protein YkvA (DUF1232 family)
MTISMMDGRGALEPLRRGLLHSENRYAGEVARNDYEREVSMNLKERSIKLKTDIPAIYLALKKKETPLSAKICAGVTIVYTLSPIDLIPDFIPVLGYLDDLIILPPLVALTVKLIPHEVFEQCRSESEGLWLNERPRKWIYALPIAAIWVLLVFIIIRAIWF